MKAYGKLIFWEVYDFFFVVQQNCHSSMNKTHYLHDFVTCADLLLIWLHFSMEFVIFCLIFHSNIFIFYLSSLNWFFLVILILFFFFFFFHSPIVFTCHIFSSSETFCFSKLLKFNLFLSSWSFFSGNCHVFKILFVGYWYFFVWLLHFVFLVLCTSMCWIF